jgi:acetyl esterase/lipase
MSVSKRAILIGLGVQALLSGCNTLTLFNNFTPKDGGVRQMAKDIAYGTHERHKYDIYSPSNLQSPLPVLVFFYGGGWNSGSRSDYSWMGKSLAALGYVVAIVDYRLYPDVVYPDFLDDAAKAFLHIQKNAADYRADPERMAVMGHSAGAYIAVMLALDSQWLKFDPLTTPLKACIGLAGPYDFYPFDVRDSINSFGTYPDPPKTQPIFYAHKTRTQFLFQDSRADQIVGLRNAKSLNALLLKAGSKSRVVTYESLSHQDLAALFSIPFRSKAPVREESANFLKEVL